MLGRLKKRFRKWSRRVDGATRKLAAAKAKDNPKGIRKWGRKLDRRLQRKAEAKKALAAERKARKARTRKPRIVKLTGVPMDNLFGALGALVGSVGHYTAGVRDRTWQHALELCRSINGLHRSKGWGAIAYHYCIAADGTIILCRPTGWKGAHVAGLNTGRIGIMVHGTTGDRWTDAQIASYDWLLDHAHTTALPESHRTSRKLRDLPVWGHRDLNATSCPGEFYKGYTTKGKSK